MTGSLPSQAVESAPSPLQQKMLRRGRMLGKFFSIQVIVQLLGLGCGLLIVRSMDKQDYAYFTIMMMMQGTMNTLTDMGICGALMSIGGRVWRDNTQLSRLIRTANSLRFKLGLVVMAVIGPVLMWLLTSNGSSWQLALVLVGLAGLTLFFQARLAISMAIPRLLARINLIQNLELMSAIVRLLLLLAAAALFMNTIIAVSAAIVAFAVQSWILAKQNAGQIDPRAEVSPEYAKEMRGIVAHAAPNALFSCVQGQLMVWLVSIFGNSSAVADIGALSRPALALGIITAFCGNLIFPRFARAQDFRGMALNFLLAVAVYVAATGGMIGLTWLFPYQVLWLLGDQYMHLRNELLLMMVVLMAGYGCAMLSGLNMTKGWVKNSWLNVPLTIVVVAVAIPLSDLTTVHGVLYLSLLGFLPMFLINVWIAFNGFRAARASARRAATPST